MRRFLTPDFRFDAFDDVTAEFLSAHGIRAVILDIDNTLEPYENPEPGDRVKAWISSLSDAGISAAFVSNNDGERVFRFNRELSLPAYPKAGKPFAKLHRRAMRDMGVSKEETAVLGDQIFTDVLAGRFAGVKLAILVPPIRDKRDLLTRTKRLLERPILKCYERRKKKEK